MLLLAVQCLERTAPSALWLMPLSLPRAVLGLYWGWGWGWASRGSRLHCTHSGRTAEPCSHPERPVEACSPCGLSDLLLRLTSMVLRLSSLTGAAAACAMLLGGAALLLHLASRLASRPLVASPPLLVASPPLVSGGEALGFALIFGLGYGGCYALVQSKAALHFGHRRGFKPLQGFLFVWQMAGTPLYVKRKAHLDPARTAPCMPCRPGQRQRVP